MLSSAITCIYYLTWLIYCVSSWKTPTMIDGKLYPSRRQALCFCFYYRSLPLVRFLTLQCLIWPDDKCVVQIEGEEYFCMTHLQLPSRQSNNGVSKCQRRNKHRYVCMILATECTTSLTRQRAFTPAIKHRKDGGTLWGRSESKPSFYESCRGIHMMFALGQRLQPLGTLCILTHCTSNIEASINSR